MFALALVPLGGCRDGGSACSEPCGESAYCDEWDGQCYCEPGGFGDPREACQPHADLCAEAAELVGHGVCLHEMPDVPTWDASTIPMAKRFDVEKVTKYLAPLDHNAPLPALFSDANYYRLHFCMLKEAFEPHFPGFTYAEYDNLVYYRDTRKMYAGSVYELIGDDVPARFAFLIETPDEEPELLEEHEVYAAYRVLQDRFGVGELAYLPYRPNQIAKAETWSSAPFPIVVAGDEQVTYEAYSPGVAYGRVRRYSASEVPTATGTFGWQDILVLETISNSLAGVNAGTITGARQDLLSHLNVLAAQRGTPNAFVADPLAAFEPFDGALVRLDVADNTYTVAHATVEDANEFWATHRPHATIDDPPDAAYLDLVGLLELPTVTADDRALALSRVGGKATGLATLYRDLDPAYQVAGFGVPIAHYLSFMASNTWDADAGGDTQTLSYADTITAWLADDAFRTDTAIRRARLEALTRHMLEQSTIDSELVANLQQRIIGVFGDESVMVRFRSSSNAEDGVEFNGAGLYESTKACAADSGVEPSSTCDPDTSSRPIAHALRVVWASLWGFGAFEERELYQLDHARAGMGILVSSRFKDERANGVVFSGNPLDAEDHRITVNVQLGEVDVVGAAPGVLAELDRLTIEAGEVVDIERVVASSLAAPETPVLSDDQLRTLGAVVAAVGDSYPVEAGEHDPAEVLLDLEFKIDSAGMLKFKQIRPFLARAVDPSIASCRLE